MSAESTTTIQKGQVDLLDFIDWSSVECLNQNTSHSFVNALKQGYREDEGLYLESDADEQLMIYIPFTQVIKLHSVVVKGPEDEGPKTVKLFSNKEHMGFSNVSDFPPSDMAVLSPENLKGKPVILKYVKFQNVRSLTMFIEDNQSDADITKIQKIVLCGTTSSEFGLPELIGLTPMDPAWLPTKKVYLDRVWACCITAGWIDRSCIGETNLYISTVQWLMRVICKP